MSPNAFKLTASDSQVWSRLDTAARGNVVQIDLPAAGVTDFGSLQLRGYGRTQSAALELFINGKVQPLGRWPDLDQNVPPFNHGFTTVASKSSDTSFTVATDRLSRWSSAPDAWVHGYFGVYWADDHIAVKSLAESQRRITLMSAPGFGIVAGQSWYAYNLLEEITQPGEWYLDRSTGFLYLWPTAGFVNSDLQVSVLNGPLFSLNGVSHITLQGMQLESTRSSLVAITDGNSNTLQQLVLRNAGTSAVTVQGGSNHRLAQSYVLDSGEEGVILRGGTRASLVPGSHVVEDTEIANNARFARTYHPAVLLEGVGQVVRNNLIHDTSHSAIIFTGNEHQIERNEIRNVLSATADAGAIYTGRDWGARGNVIVNNFIHNLSSIFSSDAVHGIYLDDMVSGIEVRGNVVYRVAGNAIQSSGGRDNSITNNVLARNGTAFYTDARAYQWWKDQSTDWVNGELLDGLKALNYQSEPWASRYPSAAAIPNDWAVITRNDGNPWLYPQGTEFSLNVGYANTTWIHGLEHTVWFKTFANNINDQDPKFVNEDGLDLTLQAGSPAFALQGFQPIPFKSIGLRRQAMPPAPQ
ncbi:MAG: right-handed parallel beta-helix repeat-containing protein [Rhodoferax sp.]|nr:right-handed parallel beta-helix repeat-containing protein [Rhodoferax sp.]